MFKNIKLCMLVTTISLHLSLPSLAMDNDPDQQVRDRITRKIAKYEIKISDLRRLLENFQINQENERPRPTTPPRDVDINTQVPTTPLQAPQQILHQVIPSEITQDQIRNHIREMYASGNYTYADIGVLLGYPPDKLQDTPDGKSTGKVAVERFLEGSNSPSLCSKFREKVRTGVIRFSGLQEREDRRNPVWPLQNTPVKPIIIPSPFPHLPGNPDKIIIPTPKPEPVPVPMGAQPVTPTVAPVQRRQPVTPIVSQIQNQIPSHPTQTRQTHIRTVDPQVRYAVGNQPYDEDTDPMLSQDGFDFSPYDPQGELRDYERGIQTNTWKGGDPSSSDDD